MRQSKNQTLQKVFGFFLEGSPTVAAMKKE
jgi:hypothetical protein